MIDMWSLQFQAMVLTVCQQGGVFNLSIFQSFNSKTIALPSVVIPSADITTCLQEELL